MRADHRFTDEKDRFALRCVCEDCAHFDRSGDECAHEWPTELHRERALLDGEWTFCKEFELC